MNRKILFSKIRRQVQLKLNGYLSVEQITDDEKIKSWIVPAAHGDETGIVGAMALSQATFQEASGSAAESAGGGSGSTTPSAGSSAGSSGGSSNGRSPFDVTSFIFGVAAAILVGTLISKVK